jgi:hypothetical protein
VCCVCAMPNFKNGTGENIDWLTVTRCVIFQLVGVCRGFSPRQSLCASVAPDCENKNPISRPPTVEQTKVDFCVYLPARGPVSFS